MITFGALLPHPPIIVPGIGRPHDLEQVKQTTDAMQEIDRIYRDPLRREGNFWSRLETKAEDRNVFCLSLYPASRDDRSYFRRGIYGKACKSCSGIRIFYFD